MEERTWSQYQKLFFNGTLTPHSQNWALLYTVDEVHCYIYIYIYICIYNILWKYSASTFFQKFRTPLHSERGKYQYQYQCQYHSLSERDISTSLFLQLRIFTWANLSLEELKDVDNEAVFNLMRNLRLAL